MPYRIYVDSGVLLAAARGTDKIAQEAFAQFCEAFFMTASAWAELTPYLAQTAFDIAMIYGLSAMDALHVAAAITVNADEFVTSERAASPLLRDRMLPVRTIQPAND